MTRSRTLSTQPPSATPMTTMTTRPLPTSEPGMVRTHPPELFRLYYNISLPCLGGFLLPRCCVFLPPRPFPVVPAAEGRTTSDYSHALFSCIAAMHIRLHTPRPCLGARLAPQPTPWLARSLGRCGAWSPSV
eukprot:scaffold130418_cov33-Phaeocystis_antarctica.AAC.1